MAGNKYIANSSGTLAEVIANQTSVGAGDAGKIPALDATGRLDTSMMPVGVVADTASIVTSEIIAAGAFVNIWNSAGAFKVRNADASTSGKEAHGFCLTGAASGASATVYFAGTNTQVTSATPGVAFLSATTPGGFQMTAPSATGQTVQRLGVAISATTINFTPELPVTLA